MQDIKDDRRAGVKSTTLLFGRNTKPILTGFAVTVKLDTPIRLLGKVQGKQMVGLNHLSSNYNRKCSEINLAIAS